MSENPPYIGDGKSTPFAHYKVTDKAPNGESGGGYALDAKRVEEVVDQVTEHVRSQHAKCDETIAAYRKANEALRAEGKAVQRELDGIKMQMGFNNLTREQSRQLLDFFMYRLGSTRKTLADLRDELAATLPGAYNAWYGSDVVKVVSVNDPTREWKA